MIYFLYGPDSFTISQKLNEIKKRFLEKDTNGLNLDVLEGGNITFGAFDQAISTLPFLSDKRLVIIKNLLLTNKDSDLKLKVLDRIKKIKDEDLNIFFIEDGEPDKRSGLYKFLDQKTKKQYFAVKSSASLNKFVREIFLESSIKANERVIDDLVTRCGPDLWRLFNESNKISLYVQSQGRDEATPRDLDLLISSEFNPNVFELIEKASQKRKGQALKILEQFLENGENEQYLLSMIYYQIRTMLIIKDFLDRGKKVTEIFKLARMNPYVVKKTAATVAAYKREDLITLFEKVIDSDFQIKKGDCEPRLALALLLARL